MGQTHLKPERSVATPQRSDDVAIIAPFDILEVTIPEAEDQLPEVDDPAVLNVILKREKTRPSGPRKGILAAIEERLEELENEAA